MLSQQLVVAIIVGGFGHYVVKTAVATCYLLISTERKWVGEQLMDNFTFVSCQLSPQCGCVCWSWASDVPPFRFIPPPKHAPFNRTAPNLKPVQCTSWCIHLLHHHHMHGASLSCYHLPASSGFHYMLVSARMCVSRGHLNPNPAGLKPWSRDRTPRCSSVGALLSVPPLPGHGPPPATGSVDGS